MKIDWRYKWMLITYEGNTIHLQGQLDSLPAGSVLQVTAVTTDIDTTNSSYVPARSLTC
jgi:hypothetical protein